MDYPCDLPVGNDQLEAIGAVAVEWSFLESVIDAAIWNLAGVPDQDIGEAITTHLPAQGRLQILATLFDLSCERDWQPSRPRLAAARSAPS